MKKLLIACLLLLPVAAMAFMGDDEIALLQQTTAGWPIGDKIAFWAEQFIGLPYDPDPDGSYVTRGVIISDDRVDCMYHAFRSVELAVGKDPADSVTVALDKRFHSRGVMENGRVINYGQRFRYAEDMISSGKWGREITAELNGTEAVRGTRGNDMVAMIPKRKIPEISARLRNGDFVFFVKHPAKRSADEIIGHIGIIKIEEDRVYLISAFGQKNKGGKVKKTLFSEYSAGMPFIGVQISRME